MTNLSDLLPAGAASKQLSFTASGAIANGQAVGLNSDGTVSVISGNGSVVEYEDGSVRGQTASGIFDSANNKVIVSYSDSGDSNKGKAVVGTVSGLSISFGTPVQFHAGQTYYGGISFDTNAGKCLIVYFDGDTNQTEAIVGTVSGTSISFGTAATVTTNYGAFPAVAYDSTAQKHLVTYRDDSDSSIGKAKVATISGTSVSFGSEATFEPGRADAGKIAYDANAQKLVVSYYDGDNSSYGTSAVGTISGTSVSFGTPVVFRSATTSYLSTSYDANAQKVVIAYNDGASTYLPKAIVGTVSGTSITFGAAASLGTVPVNGAPSVAYNPDTQKHTIVWGNQQSPYQVYQVTATVSGTSISATSAIVIYDATNGAGPEPQSLVYDTNSDKMVLQMRKGSTDEGIAFVLNSSFVPASSFLGIADAAISNAASGKITMKGGVITNSSLVPDVPVISVGTAGDTSDTGQHMAAAYDANAQRVVTFYRDNNNSNYGTSAVGTVSGTSITFGTPVVFNSASTTECTAAYNSTAQKVMVAFNSAGSTGKAIYGAVSGTTIDFSSYTVTQFDSNNISEMQVVFDTNAEKMVIAYKLPGSESQLGKAVVGTLSGTTLSFGTAVTFNNAATTKCAAAYDSTNNKVVISYSDAGNSNYPTSIVGTVSGTSISFGSETVIANVSGSYIATTYDSGNQKIIVSYQDVSDSNAGKVAIGTVSGTNITFGTPVAFPESLAVGGWLSSAYDPDNGIVALNFKNNSGNAGTCVPAIVSGSTFSFGASVVFETGSTEYTSTVYDTNADKFVVAFNDGGGGDQGRAVVQTSSKTVGVTPNQIYYVQNDGTLSTTSSSVTAGKAMSATSINLDYST